MVVATVLMQDPEQMVLVEDDDVVGAFSANRADDALNVWVLPRCAGPPSLSAVSVLSRGRICCQFAGRSHPILVHTKEGLDQRTRRWIRLRSNGECGIMYKEEQ